MAKCVWRDRCIDQLISQSLSTINQSSRKLNRKVRNVVDDRQVDRHSIGWLIDRSIDPLTHWSIDCTFDFSISFPFFEGFFYWFLFWLVSDNSAWMMADSHAEFHGLSHLYPALIQVFAVIVSGYVCGRSGLISNVQGQGLNTFVSMFALPCMLFRAMATLNFASVNWALMSSVLISKAIVFFAVVILTMLVTRPVKWGRAGIFAITATQSNDFALGYPICRFRLFSK